MKTYNGVILKVDKDRNHIRFGWHDPSLFDREKEFCPKLKPDSNFNGICQTANADITAEQMAILNRCGVLRVVDDQERVMVETPFYNIPRLMRQDDQRFFPIVLGVLNEKWYGEIMFFGDEWRGFPGRAWVRFDVVDQGKVLLAQKR